MKRILLIILLSCQGVFAATMPDLRSDALGIARAVGKMDTHCVQLEEHHPCMVGEIPGVWISYYAPSLIALTQGRKSAWTGGSHGNLQFFEAHIYDFPLKEFQQAALCETVTDHSAGLRYLSEVDEHRWRQEKEAYPRDLIPHWGYLHPTTGFVNHYSPAVASVLIALRGITAARVLSGHIAQAPIIFGINQFQDRIQMVEPQQQMCMALGTSPQIWEHRTEGDIIDPKGNYTWIFWRFTECCKIPAPVPTSL